jgi:2-polyprenyl-3-methyl-5-hydroxy-6-metoxy-1,4-benzoquinol methylase
MDKGSGTTPGMHEVSMVGCDVCGGLDYAVVSTKGRFNVPLTNVVCKNCGFVYVHPRPDKGAVGDFYRDEYESSKLYFRDDIPAEELDQAAVKAAQSRLNFLVAHLGSTPRHAALEVGSGPGTFLGLLKNQGWKRCVGVEPVPRLAGYATTHYEIAAHQGMFEDCDFGDQQFDLIAMFHVLEHMVSPTMALRRCRQLLSPGGLLYIEIPDLFHPNRSRPEDFFQAAHLSTFSANTLRRALIKEQLEPMIIQQCGNFLRGIARRAETRSAEDTIKDDWEVVARMIEFRRKWYPVVGLWKDALSATNSAARQVVKRGIMLFFGNKIGRRAVSVLRRF